MNDYLHLAALAAALLMTPIAAKAQPAEPPSPSVDSSSTGDASSSDVSSATGASASSDDSDADDDSDTDDDSASPAAAPSPESAPSPDLQPNYTPVSSGQPSSALGGGGGGSGGTVVILTVPRGEQAPRERPHIPRRRRRVSEIHHDADSGKVLRGAKESERGDREEYRGIRLIAEGKRIEGPEGARLEEKGAALVQRGARQETRGREEFLRRGRVVNGGSAVRTQARREVRRAARSEFERSETPRPRPSVKPARPRDEWHQD
ncbi:MAG TPA: hypothetical protein VH309_07250 [Elusimicrobiota bacterium]|jgi:hypothetical protein|nr:hypothetical protein [Elusimicrobiota bacterium]